MSNIDKQKLREAAQKATKGQWAVEFDDEIYSTDGVNHEQIAMVFSENEARDAAFIAAANPATVLALLDELEAKDKLNAELMEKQRLIDICQGQGLEHRIAAEKRAEAAEKRIAELEARDKPIFVQCWSCKHDIEVLAIADCDGYCPRCAAPIDLDNEPYAAAGKGE